MKTVETNALHPDKDSAKAELATLYTDFTQLNAVWYSDAFECINLKAGQVTQTSKVLERRLNPNIDLKQFARPAG